MRCPIFSRPADTSHPLPRSASRPWPGALITALVAAQMATLLAGCGGGDTPVMEAQATEARRGITAVTAIAADPAPAGGTADPVPPLLADDGSVWPTAPQAVPADTAARTTAGHYATAAQADQLAAAMAGRILRVQLPAGAAGAVDEAAAVVMSQLDTQEAGRETPVLVQGSDLHSAAALVDRLAALGVTRSWLVTQ